MGKLFGESFYFLRGAKLYPPALVYIVPPLHMCLFDISHLSNAYFVWEDRVNKFLQC